jgi:fructokinase
VEHSYPEFVSAGEALTDLITEDAAHQRWLAKTGGATWNVARAMAALGVSSAFAGAISSDVFGDALWQASLESGLDVRFLQRNAHSPLLAVVHSTSPPAYYFIGVDSADLHFDPAQLPMGWMAHAKWVHFGGISLARAPLGERLVQLARAVKQAGGRISFDPNYRNLMKADYLPTLRSMVLLADVVKVSEEDIEGFFPGEPVMDAFQALRALNPSAWWLLTRGGNGATLYQGERQWDSPAVQVAVVDTVGAGDASIAGFVYSLMRNPGFAPGDHLRFAAAAGAAACTAAGATPPQLDEVRALLGKTNKENK